jgi:hypothetical protein
VPSLRDGVTDDLCRLLSRGPTHCLSVVVNAELHVDRFSIP